MARPDTEEQCHCGSQYDGSDHCPYCGCEQYETGDCGETHPYPPGSPHADCYCKRHRAACAMYA